VVLNKLRGKKRTILKWVQLGKPTRKGEPRVSSPEVGIEWQEITILSRGGKMWEFFKAL